MNSYQSRLKEKSDLSPHVIALMAVTLLALGVYIAVLHVQLDRAPSLMACMGFMDQLEASEILP